MQMLLFCAISGPLVHAAASAGALFFFQLGHLFKGSFVSVQPPSPPPSQDAHSAGDSAPPPTSIPLVADQLTARYGQTPILHDVDVKIPAGKITILVGPNGSGKSTLLATLSRLLKPASGTVLLDGKALHTLPPRQVARRLGLLPQSPLVPEGLTVYDLVSRGRYPHQGFLRQWTDADESAVVTAMDLTGTVDYADRPLEALSGGQRQRCFIALALAQQTDIILFDEPTSYLDLRYQVEIMDLIGRLSRDHGRTVVAVLHDLNFAMQYADRLIFLKKGRIHRVLEDVAACTVDLVEEVFETPVVRMTHPDSALPVFLPCVPGGAL